MTKNWPTWFWCHPKQITWLLWKFFRDQQSWRVFFSKYMTSVWLVSESLLGWKRSSFNTPKILNYDVLYPIHTSKTFFLNRFLLNEIINRKLKSFIFHRIQVRTNLYSQCAAFKSKNIRRSSFYEKKKCVEQNDFKTCLSFIVNWVLDRNPFHTK